MISFEPRVGIVFSGLTSGGFTVIIPFFYFDTMKGFGYSEMFEREGNFKIEVG